MNPPGQAPDVDNQANAETCTAAALSKAVCGGFENLKYKPGYLDFNQAEIRSALLAQKDKVLFLSKPINKLGK